MFQWSQNLKISCKLQLKKKALCYAILDGIYGNRQWFAEKQINNGCPKPVPWREMKPLISNHGGLGPKKVTQQSPTCKSVPMRRCHMSQDTEVMTVDDRKLPWFMEAARQRECLGCCRGLEFEVQLSQTSAIWPRPLAWASHYKITDIIAKS